MDNNCCRTCLSDLKETRHIDTVIVVAGEDVRLSDILSNFYHHQASEDDMFPKYLCINCTYQLTMTYSFKKVVESSIKELTERIGCAEASHNDYTSDNEEMKDEYVQNDASLYSNQNFIRESEKTVDLFCVNCKANFSSSKSLYDHCINKHPATNSDGRPCEYCNEKFEDFRTLIMHRKLHLKPYICENCWKGFNTVTDKMKHQCQPDRDKPKENSDKKSLRQCDQCGKSYPPGYIRIHILTHGDNRAYSCKYCPKKFKVPGGLNSHVQWNHKRTRNHRCEVCNATFITASSRSSHIRKNHLKETKYSCESCGKRFFSKSELQRHSLTHTGVKNFHCHLCDKSYQTRYGLNVHLKSHSQILNIMSL